MRLLLLFTILFSLFFPSWIHAEKIHTYKVIIIGAGIAGLETARYLHEHHENNFIVLESRDRMGGRIQTIKIWNTNLDLGAGWIHGAGEENPIMALAKKWDMPTMISNMNAYTLYDSHGKKITLQEEDYYTELYQQFRKFLSQQQNEDINSQKALSDAVVAFIKIKSLNRTEQHEFIYQISNEIEQDYAADIRNLSLMWFDNDKSFAGPDRIATQGYQKIIEGLSQHIKDRVLLNHVVQKINYTQRKIIVTTRDHQQFTADYVVCTVPMGVLKAGTIKFTPQLPQDKRLAIDHHIGMGILNRVILRFPHVFWDNSEWVERVAPAYWSYNHWVHKGEWIEFINMNYYIHQPILTALVSADFAKNLEQQSNKTIINQVMQVLRTLYGNHIPSPSSFLITRWGQDPYSKGSYSNLRPGALNDSDDYRVMAKPIKEHLLFAGEATNAQYPATTYGAYLSGQRAARFIIDHSIQSN